MSFLEVKNIKKSFGDVQVLKGIDFSLERGDVVAIIGSSGSGKTTLLRSLNFLEHPDHGCVTLDGKPSAHYENTVVITDNGVEILTL
jgi:polar amino acid transport system ATP-binding protein